MLDRRQRIVQASAGPFMELVIAGIASLVIFAFPEVRSRTSSTSSRSSTTS